MLWVDEGADIDEANVDKLKSTLITPMMLLNVLQWGLAALGLLLFITCVFFFAKKLNRGSRTKY